MASSRPPRESSVTPGRSRPEADYEHIDDDVCRSFQRSVEIVGKKWTAAVLMAAMRGDRRFVDYRARITGISNQMLSQRLRELEGHQLIERIVVPTTPVQITYRPTEQGASLMRVLHPLIEWSANNEAMDT
ncbi:helix-turn-helix domain-containing protein [Streptomyces sp. IB2014 016-6]|uniref:winged helix-turn-helix transcriptional regulator n=1 Tax=Streptomyces sp. IB2014 016-6 TaxID=2517818 RepID=UPI0011CA394F|nr:helix-turn-helix domain-containing protein [Streptomyces sp. IB2014 016-6]TXL83789.1 transcriptional regulator [Streptomyces sp. IB2014 016-6]